MGGQFRAYIVAYARFAVNIKGDIGDLNDLVGALPPCAGGSGLGRCND
jgi:hypothetical protein